MKEKAYQIDRNRKYYGNQRALASMVYIFFLIKKRSGVNVNEELAKELHIKNSKEEHSMRDLNTIFYSRYS